MTDELRRRHEAVTGAMYATQARIAGFVLRELWNVQAFVKEFCIPRDTPRDTEKSQKQRLHANAKRIVADPHTLCQPWIQLLSKLVDAKPLRRLQRWVQQAERVTLDDERAIVYCRFSLSGTTATYIGETEHWKDRQMAHFRVMLHDDAESGYATRDA